MRATMAHSDTEVCRAQLRVWELRTETLGFMAEQRVHVLPANDKV